MQSTRPVLFKRLAQVIHLPLPLNSRQSQQLLSLLTNSFQRHLDKQHPSPASTSDNDSVRGHSRPIDGMHHSSFITANKHFDSLVTNPVFSRLPRESLRSPKSQPSVQPSPHTNPSSPGDLDWVAQSAFDLLQEKLARGTLTAENVVTCLQAIFNCRIPMERMRELGLCSKIIQWIEDSNQIPLPTLLRDIRCRRFIVPILVDEGRTDMIWRWLLVPSVDANEEIPKIKLLKAFVATTLFRRGLKQAMELVISASSRGICRVYLGRATTLITETLVLNPTTIEEVGHELFESYAALVHCYEERAIIDKLVLDLYHPASPNPDLALGYISIHATEPSPEMWSRVKRDAKIGIYLRLANELLQLNRLEEANNVLRLSQDLFPAELGVLQPHATQPMQDLPSKPTKHREQQVLAQLEGLLST